MKLQSIYSGIRICAVTVIAAMAFATPSFAQGYGQPPQQQPPSQQQPGQPGASGQAAPGQAAPPEVPKLNPQEEADYKALLALPQSDKATADQKIQLGQAFLEKYPASRYNETVLNLLVNAYYTKQDWTNFYDTADKAVAKDPDDVDVITVVGWVIPHLYSRDDPNADKKLDKAEGYEKHAIEVLPTIPKPDNLTDEEFATAKSGQLEEAHSGLGLVYFRKGDYQSSVKELQLATQGASPDPTDLYALAVGLQQLNRNSEAADAYTKCAQIPGGLQSRCKQSADAARKAH
ncbi:MAG: hypothetical protein ACRD4C_07070 [Candidatus Acidiferrales bacterium]